MSNSESDCGPGAEWHTEVRTGIVSRKYLLPCNISTRYRGEFKLAARHSDECVRLTGYRPGIWVYHTDDGHLGHYSSHEVATTNKSSRVDLDAVSPCVVCVCVQCVCVQA